MILRRLSFLLPVVLAACAAPGPSVEVPVRDEPLRVIVLHTNDVHGQVLPRRATWLDVPAPPLVGGLPLVAAYVNAVRDEARREGAALFVVDAGDWFQGTPEGRVDGGLAMLRAMGAVGYDAMAVGNHELDRGLAHLVGLLGESGLPAVCANLVDPRTQERVAWVAPWRVVEHEGLRVAFVGLLGTETPEITHPDARTLGFVEPAAALAEARRALAGQADWIVPLTHIGIEADRELARAHPDLALIVGGHSHTYLKEGERAGGTLIVQVGAKASAVGRVDALVDRASGAVLAIEERAVDLDAAFPETWRDPEVEHLCRAMVDASAAAMAEVLGELAAPLARAREPLASSTAGNLIADAFRERTGADVALMNRGGIRRDLEAGPVTRRDVFELLPFDNHLVTLTLSGAELAECLRRSVEGGSHSGLDLSGAVLEVASSDGAGPRLAGVRVGGRPLDPAAAYRVTLNSFMAQGGDDFLPSGAGRERVEDPILMRELLEQLFVDRGRVVPSDESRYVLVAP